MFPPPSTAGQAVFCFLFMVGRHEWAIGMCSDGTYSLEYPMENIFSVIVLAGKWLWPSAALTALPKWPLLTPSSSFSWRRPGRTGQVDSPTGGMSPPRRRQTGFLDSEFLDGMVCNDWSPDGMCGWATPTRVWPPCLPRSHLDLLVETKGQVSLSFVSQPFAVPLSFVTAAYFSDAGARSWSCCMRLQCQQNVPAPGWQLLAVDQRIRSWGGAAEGSFWRHKSHFWYSGKIWQPDCCQLLYGAFRCVGVLAGAALLSWNRV